MKTHGARKTRGAMAKLAWPCSLHNMPTPSVGMAPNVSGTLRRTDCQSVLRSTLLATTLLSKKCGQSVRPADDYGCGTKITRSSPNM